MKDFTLSVAGVLVLALILGLVFNRVYPLVDIDARLAGLFVFIAAIVKLGLGKLWTLLHKPRPVPTGETAK
jgi:hypothetical protein